MTPHLDPVYRKESVTALERDLRAADYEWRAMRRDPQYYVFFQQAVPPTAHRALDLGCGAGRLTLLLASQVEQTFGLDVSPTLLMLAQDRERSQPGPRVHWVMGDLHHMPFPKESFDCIVSSNALRLADLSLVLPRIHLLLVPGGRMVVRDVLKSSVLPTRFVPHLYATLKNLPSLAQMYGPLVALAICRERLSPSGRQFMDRERELPPHRVKQLYAETFPGCQINSAPRRIDVIWNKPPHSPT